MKNIWIIGASEGIGRALALELAKNKNHFLIVSARNHERLNEVCLEIGPSSQALPLDVSNTASVKKAWDTLCTNRISIDTVIYGAGYYKPVLGEKIELDEVEKMIDINMTGAVRIFENLLPTFITRKKGHIVIIGSIAGYRGLPNSIGYGMSKAGLMHLAENLQCELYGSGIKVQMINPGFVKTRLTDLNDFPMPFIMSAEKAAKHIVKEMEKKNFESRFPFLFANGMKLLSRLPYSLYFKILKKVIPKKSV